MFSENLLRGMWPNGNSQMPTLIETLAAKAPAVFANNGLTNDLIVAHAMAQFTVECGAGTEMTEKTGYTVDRACVVWPRRFSDPADCFQKVGSFPGDPDFDEKLINFVYGGINGNVQPGDGFTYVGRGLSQVTGRGNYGDLDVKLGGHLGLVNNPNFVNTPNIVTECGVADFVMCGCLPHAAADDLLGVSSLLNLGHLSDDPNAVVGFDDRQAALKLWKLALGVTTAALHSEVWVQVSLNKLGATPALIPDGSFGQRSRTALKTFQAAHGLPTDGQITPQTLAALDQALAALP